MSRPPQGYLAGIEENVLTCKCLFKLQSGGQKIKIQLLIIIIFVFLIKCIKVKQ